MMELQSLDPVDMAGLMAETDAVAAALRQSVRDALLQHKRAGLPIVSWRDGGVVWIPADEIVVDARPDAT